MPSLSLTQCLWPLFAEWVESSRVQSTRENKYVDSSKPWKARELTSITTQRYDFNNTIWCESSSRISSHQSIIVPYSSTSACTCGRRSSSTRAVLPVFSIPFWFLVVAVVEEMTHDTDLSFQTIFVVIIYSIRWSIILWWFCGDTPVIPVYRTWMGRQQFQQQ